MRVVALETLRPRFQKNLCVVVLHTDEGVVGLGDAFLQSAAVEAYLHSHVAPLLFGLEEPTPEAVSLLLAPYVGFQGGGVEMRANGAVDVALWDLLGQYTGQTVGRLLGGPVRDTIDVYNTCAGPGYIQNTSRQASSNWGHAHGDYEDLHAFLTKPRDLAKELHAEGLRGMKVWPFDRAAERTGGNRITPADLDSALAVVRDIRDAVGMDMDLMVELHGLWSRRAAVEICRALEPYRPFWVEDPIRPDAVESIGALSHEVGVPIATGETAVGRRGFLPLLQHGRIAYATVDVQWTGGLTEARKVANLADTFSIPVAPHDCTGPITLAACFHLAMAQPNAFIQETVRAFLRTWYPRVVTGLPEIHNGIATSSADPGLGLRLADGFREDPDTARRITGIEKS
ncbi:mandelate racemase/muconate lactonizing enzyme family protein [Embleya scabrispora]|uniref:mandelate racemase/muconate lactonizing enzyme family protein n=1 Tax=Embleya scabrispora TaxID=159449 RepID=UPI0003A11613|nr:mandelate racemase/muconate lactonizing enzyme family protein [Embleya scabrispora]MYS81075.1 mandelate racemase/muconate lactonizing enzyme family protein [Streptomyces sp. SID5474]